METPNVCPKCGGRNSLFICSQRAINCSDCCDFIRGAKEGERLVDVPNEVKIPVRNLDEEARKENGRYSKEKV